MVIYAAAPLRRTRQVLADVLVLLAVYAAIRAGRAVHAAVQRLAEPGRALESAGRDIGTSLHDAAAQVGGLPLVGDGVRVPLDRAATATGALVRAGHQQQVAVGQLAMLLGVLIAVVPVLLVLAVWLPARVRFVRRAGAAQRFVDADADLDLFALRAMAHQPMHLLARISADPVGAWRRGDPDVVRRLAVLELRSVGLRPPPSSP